MMELTLLEDTGGSALRIQQQQTALHGLKRPCYRLESTKQCAIREVA